MNAQLSAGDTAWMLVSTALVVLMVPGLAFFYGGLVRSRAALNTLMMTFASVAIVSLQWVLIGYSLAFSPGRGVGGLGWFGLHGVVGTAAPYAATVPHLLFVAYQMIFAGLTVALISGAMVERIRFSLFLGFAVLWTTLVYDPLAHWVWSSDGWLHALGALDFAGGTVVHISAGTAALVSALVLGRRRDLGRSPLLPHSVPLTLLGAGMLAVGWIGFNAGSAFAADSIAATALLTSLTAAAAAMIGWLSLDLIRTRQATAVGGATGMVVGLVAITPAAGYVTPLSAIAIGLLGAGASYAAIQARSKTRVDDALDVFACHGVAGIVGSILTGVFASRAANAAGADGLLFGNARLLGVQTLAVVCTIAFAAPMTLVVLWVARLAGAGALRVPAPAEAMGVDIAEHGEHAYHDGDAGALAGGLVRLGEGVLMPSRRQADRH